MNGPTKEYSPPVKPDRILVLVGLMGAGKTTIGRRLATRLGLRFVDADAEIEIAAGCSVADIFHFHGEEAFRDGERRVIARILTQPVHVLATGGGAYMDPETRARISECAISIWLRADASTLIKRVKRRDTRPLLYDSEPEQIIERLVAERYPIYAGADIVVDSADGPHTNVVNSIVDELAVYYHARNAGAGDKQDRDPAT